MDREQCRALLDVAHAAVAVVGERGTYQFANSSVERVVGVDRADLVGESLFEAVHPQDESAVRTAFEAVRDATDDRTERVEYRHADGDGDWVRLEGRVSNEHRDALGGYVVSSRPVRATAPGDAATGSRLSDFAENTDDVLWMVSGDWSDVAYVNSALERMYGVSPAEFVANPTAFLDAVHPDDRRRVEDAMATLTGGDAVDIEFRVGPDRNYRRHVWMQGEPIVDDRTVQRIVCFTRDVTDRRRRERQLEVMDRLLRHNLRNDLNVVLGHARLARERGDEDVASSMDTIIDTGEELLTTANKERDIVDVLANVDGPQRIDLVDAVADAVASVRASHGEADLDADLPESVPVRALPEIELAVSELVENAISHALADEPTVSVRIRDRADYVQLTVRDQGPPIPEHEFQTLTTDREPDELHHGSGLGLWMVYWIVDLSEGNIDFTATESRGNVVTVRLRRAPD